MPIKFSAFKDIWFQSELERCPTFAVEALGQEQTSSLIERTLKNSYSYLYDIKFAEKQFQFCQIPGTEASDYQYRNLDSPLGPLVSSIRFLGGDLSKPFVFIVHFAFEINTIERIEKLSQFLKEEYALFKPKKIRWFSKEVNEDFISSHSRIEPDLVFYAEQIDYIQSLPVPKKFEELELKAATSLSWYDEYVTSYKAIMAAWPRFADMTQIESKESMQGMIDEGILYEAYIDQGLAGLIAMKPYQEGYYAGYCVWEEVLFEKFRGKGYAAALQRANIEQLEKSKQLIFGTIHYHNIPSRKTAARVGRKETGIYLFAMID